MFTADTIADGRFGQQNIRVSRLPMNLPMKDRNGHDCLDLPPVIDHSLLREANEALPQEIVAGCLHRGCKMAVGGGSKSNKTWLLLDLALSVAYGKPWLGLNTFQGRVLFINMEIQRPFFTNRLEQVAKAKGITIEHGKLDIWNLRGYSQSYEVLINKFLDWLETEHYDLIILDPIYKLLGDADENKATDVTKMLNAFDRMTELTKAALSFVAHFSKGNQAGKDAIDRISGSGVFGRDPDAIMSVTRHEEDNCYTVTFTLRNSPPIPPFVIRWDHPLAVRVDFDPSKLAQASRAGANRKYSPETIMRQLPATGLRRGDWYKIVKEELGTSRATFNRIVEELNNNGMIVNDNGLWVPFLA